MSVLDFIMVMAVCLDVLGAARLLFLITSGVVQGCPLSGLLFALASDPTLNCFDERLVSGAEALVAACDDDIGMAIKSIELLAIATVFFENIFRASLSWRSNLLKVLWSLSLLRWYLF